MPAKSKSQQRLFGMVHAYQKGKLKDAPESVKEIVRSISDEDAEHFAKTKHKGLPEKKACLLDIRQIALAELASVKTAAAAAAPAPAFPTTGPVGFRNNNPGNLKSDGRTMWEGATNVPAKGEWLKFNTPTSGIRAMSRTLYNYGKKHGINTTKGVISRFAPPKDSNSNNTKYLSHIKSMTGFAPEQVIDLTKEDTLQRLVPAMGSFEIGQDSWGTYNPSVVSNAVIRGIPVKTTQKRTVK